MAREVGTAIVLDDKLQDLYIATMNTDFDLRSLFSVEGLVVVITGGGTGIGLMVCPFFSISRALILRMLCL